VTKKRLELNNIQSTKKRILIVDDDPADLDLLTHWLSDYTTMCAFNGIEGLLKISSFCPDLIITDGHMPEMNGFEFCRQVRGKGIRTPIAFNSSSRSNDNMALEAGADIYVQKPDRESIMKFCETAIPQS